MPDFIFQGGEARIVEERGEPGIEARRAHPRRAIGTGLIERGEGLVLLPERGMNRGEMSLVDVMASGKRFEIGEDLPRALRLTPMKRVNGEVWVKDGLI